MRKIIASCCFIALACLNPEVYAITHSDKHSQSHDSNFYISEQLGYGRAVFPDESNDFFNGGVAGRVAVGYDYNKYLGLELGGSVFGNFAWGSATPYAIDLLAKSTLPLNSKISLFGKGGAAYTSLGSINTVRPKLAGGIEYNLSKKVGLDLSYSRIFGRNSSWSSKGTPDLDMTTLGLRYRF